MPRLTDGLEQIFSSLGVVGAGYKLYFYETSTTTPKSTYSDEALTTPNTNPVVLNAAGRPDTDIWGADPSTYRMLLGDADSTSVSVLVSPIVDIDPIDNLDVNNIAGLTPIPTAYWGTTAGTSSNYTLNPALVDITAYDNTQTFYLDFHTACSAGADIDINGLGALDLKKYKGDGTKIALEDNDVLPSRYSCINDGTDIVILNPNITEYSKNNKLNLNPNTETISSGAITYSGAHMVIDTEGAAASDDLDTISGANDGDIAILQISDSSRNVVLKHGTGNLNLVNGQDVTLDTVTDKITLIFRGSSWDQLSRTLGSDFTSIKTISGYTKLPNGIIMQWGRGESTGNYNFPIAFPNACLTLTFGSVGWSGGSNNGIPRASSNFNQTGFTYSSALEASTDFYYIAIGY